MIAGRNLAARYLRSSRSRLLSYYKRARFELSSRLSHHRLVDASSPAVVSLTSYGRRLETVHLAIESIGAGTVRPKRIMLWISDDDRPRITPALRRLTSRGLEILTCYDWRSHKKYFPYCVSHTRDRSVFVTCDDDVFYPRGWLRDLLVVSEAYPDHIVAHRTRVMAVDGNDLLPYANWVPSPPMSVGYRHLPIGVGGVAYPPSLLDQIASRGTLFWTLAPSADDLWLKSCSLKSRLKVIGLNCRPHWTFPDIRSAGSRTGLAAENVGGGGNDIQSRAIFDDSDIQLIAGEIDSNPAGSTVSCAVVR